jgi:hypothetical protein
MAPFDCRSGQALRPCPFKNNDFFRSLRRPAVHMSGGRRRFWLQSGMNSEELYGLRRSRLYSTKGEYTPRHKRMIIERIGLFPKSVGEAARWCCTETNASHCPRAQCIGRRVPEFAGQEPRTGDATTKQESSDHRGRRRVQHAASGRACARLQESWEKRR